jgi:hypothetical protein
VDTPILGTVRDRIVTTLGATAVNPVDILAWLQSIFTLLTSCNKTPTEAVEYVRSSRIFRRRYILRTMRKQWANYETAGGVSPDDLAEAALLVVRNCSMTEFYAAYRQTGKLPDDRYKPTEE